MIKRGMASAQRRHRLPEQSRVPNTPDLEYLFGEAAKQPGHLVELPWTIDRQQFVLTAKLERRNNEQSHQWSFYRGDGPSSKLEWSYESSDVVMIHSLIMTAFPPEPVKSDPAALAALQPGIQQDLQVTINQQGQADSGSRKIRGVMEGSLADMPLHSLLTSIQSSRLTGKLLIHAHDEIAEMFFEDGNLYQVRRPMQAQEGEDAFFELFLSSSTGDFKFFDAESCEGRTINLRTESLMLKAAALSDHSQFLDRQGLKPDSCLMRANPNLTEKEFEQKLSNLVPVDMSLQKRMYQAVDNKTLFADLLKQCALSRSSWTPLIFNLISSGIVNIENKVEEAPAPPQNLEQTGSNLTIDLIALEKFTTSMTRRDTGIYTEIAFLFFLEHEFYRFHSYETPFTLVLFKFARKNGEISKEMNKSILEVVKNTVRKADILGHYEGDDYALILPHTEPSAASGLVHRLNSLMQAPPFTPNDVALSMGIAGIPEDCQDLMSLLKIARHRKKNPS